MECHFFAQKSGIIIVLIMKVLLVQCQISIDDYTFNNTLLFVTDPTESINLTAPNFEEGAPPNFMTANPPQAMTEEVRRYLGRWAATPEGPFYFFKHPEPVVTGFTPGVVLSSRQVMTANITDLFEEASFLQTRMERLYKEYIKTVQKTTLMIMAAQASRYQLLYDVYKNETILNETKLDEADKDWIFSFTLGAIETENIIDAFRNVLRRYNYLIKKIICIKEGRAKAEQSHHDFIMVYVETDLTEEGANNLIARALRKGQDSCQFVEASPSFVRYRFFRDILGSREKVKSILVQPNIPEY